MNPTHEWLNQPDGITVRLRALRKQADLSGTQLAGRLGWQQSKVSRLENGKQMPTAADLEAWTRACGHQEILAELLTTLDEVQATHREWQRRLRQGGHAAIQVDFVRLVQESARIRNFEISVIPGPLQTPEYARKVFVEMAGLHEVEDDIDAAVAARMQRQAYLYDPQRQWEFLLDESVLRRPVHGKDVTRAQLDRLHTVIGLGNVRLGVLPLGQPLKTSPQNSFCLFDDLALVETFIGETAHEGAEAAKYHRVMDRMWEEAVVGEDVRPLIARAVEDLM